MGYAASPSVLASVNRVLLECGAPTVSVLTSRPAQIALEGLNDGCHDIWSRQRWTFARGAASIALVASQRDYALPARFDRMAESFRSNAAMGYSSLVEISPEEWWRNNFGTSTQDGTPYVFTIKQLTVSFYPTPSAEFISQCPVLEFEFFQSTPPRMSTAMGTGAWDVPLDFYDAMIKYGKAKLKQHLEYPDSPMNLQEYEMSLQILKGKYREVRGAPTLKPRNVNVSEW